MLRDNWRLGEGCCMRTAVVWIYHGKTDISAEDLAINVASSGYYE